MFGRRLSLAVSGAAGAATLTAASAPSPLYPVYQRLFGFSAFTLTVIFAVYVFALLAALLTIGSLSDHVGRRPVASVALLLLAVGMLLFATAGATGDLIVARIVQGLAVGAATGTTTAMITDAAPNPRLGAIVSSGAPPSGIAVGAVLAGALVEFAPLPRQLVFWILAAAYAALAGLVWLVPERARPERTGSPWPSLRRSLRPSAGLPPAMRGVFAALLPSIVATWALSGLYLSLGSSVLGSILGVRSHFVVGVVLGVFFASGVAGTVISMTLSPRRREGFGYSTLAVGVLLTIAATLTSDLPLYIAGSIIAGLGFGASFYYAVNALSDAAPADQRGEVFATMYIASYLAFSVPALVAGLAAGAAGLKPTAFVYGAFEVLLVVVATAVSAARARRSNPSRQEEHA